MEHGGTAARIGFCCIVAGSGGALSIAACTDGPGVEQISVTSLSLALCEKAAECACGPLQADFGITGPSCSTWNLEDLFGTGGEGYDEYGGDAYGDDYGYGDDGEDTAGGKITRTFDQECAEQLAARIDALQCDGSIPDLACDQYCKLHYGTRFEGQICGSSADCAQGLVCRNDECRDPCKFGTAHEGENCDYAICEDGLVCLVEESSDDVRNATCVRLDGFLDECGDTTCAANEWCDFNDPAGPTCHGRVDEGAACTGHRQCTTEYCPAGFCAQLPGDGEPCTQEGECRDDIDCRRGDGDEVGTCVAQAPACRALYFVPYLLLGYDEFPYQSYY